MKKAKRILHIGIENSTFGGIENILYEIYKNIDREKIQFDFLSPYETTYGLYRKEIEDMGGKIFELKTYRSGLRGKILYNKRLYKFLKEKKYDIVHINSGAFFFCLQVALISKISGIKRIIVHSHNNVNMSICKKVLISLFKPIMHLLANDCLACSKDAAEALFLHRNVKNGKVKIIKNGIEINKFVFSEENRIRYRKKLELEDNVIYGNIARFHEQKNHDFLIDVFYEIQKKQKNALLVLIGDGSLKSNIKEKVERLDLKEKVKFLGVRKDVNNILQAMDCFIFPSIYEGLGIVAIEAQATGLYTICSENIPEEAKISDKFISMYLKDGAKYWANEICKIDFLSYTDKRKFAYKNAIKSGYDIRNVAKEIENIYLN